MRGNELKKINRASIAITIFFVILLSYPASIVYYEVFIPYKAAYDYDMKLVATFKEQYCRIFEGDDKCLVFLKGRKEPFVIYANEYVSRKEVVKIVNENGFSEGRIRIGVDAGALSLRSEKGVKNKDIGYFMAWSVQDFVKQEVLVIDFKSGEYKINKWNSPHK